MAVAVAAESGEAPVRVRVDLGYDGTDFAGWARQPGLRTVAGVVEDALVTIMRHGPLAHFRSLSEGHPPHAQPAVFRLTVAGRTDAGVHARGQVAHVDLPGPLWRQWGPVLVRRLAGLLPPDVRVWRAERAPGGFDARFSALSRRYAYRVADLPAGVDPLRRREVLWQPRPAEAPLDLAAMNAASAPLLGERDFAAFCRRREGATTLRRLLTLRWTRTPDGLVEGTVEADAFCHSMVRALVGSLLAVGEGRRPPSWPAEVLAGGVRHSSVQVVRPHGLTLEEVRYPPEAELAGRAAQTRRRRIRSEAGPAAAHTP